MSVARLKKELRDTWLTVDAATVRVIKHADALAVWVLLMNCPDDWEVRRPWLRAELGIGSVRLRAAVARLEALGLWEQRALRGDDGRLEGSEIIIREVPTRSPSVQVPPQSDFLDPRESSTGEHSAPYQETYEKSSSQETDLPTKPAAGGGGKRAPARETRERLSCEGAFGFLWHPAWNRYLPEERATAILISEDIEDTDAARRIVAEWAAAGARGFRDDDPAAALVWACRNSKNLAHTAGGDERLPAWAHP